MFDQMCCHAEASCSKCCVHTTLYAWVPICDMLPHELESLLCRLLEVDAPGVPRRDLDRTPVFYTEACAVLLKVLLCAIVLLVFNAKIDLAKAGFTLFGQLATIYKVEQRHSRSNECLSFRPGLRCSGSVRWCSFFIEVPVDVWPLCGSLGNKVLGCYCK